MASPAILVAGADSLGLAVIERLVQTGADVTALVSAAEEASRRRELERLGAHVVVGSARSANELRAAGIAATDVLVLTTDDDSENADAALAARRLRPDLPLVVRLFDEKLGVYLRETLTDVTILSMSSVSAPVFADLALRALDWGSDRLPVSRPRRPWRHPFEMDRVVVTTGALATVLIFVATLYFSWALDLRLIDGLYFVWQTVFTVGYSDLTVPRSSDTTKVVVMLITAAGAAFVAILYALLSGWVVARRLNALHGRVPVRGRNHVIVAGAGNVGFRVARILAARKHRVVIVERDADNRNLTDLRVNGHHVIVADGAADETLEIAGVDRAAAVLALTDSDASNLHIALAVHARCPTIPVVIRLASPELSAHVAKRRDAFAASSIEIASEEFARSALAACAPVR